MTTEATQLDPFEDQPVLAVGIEIPGAAGGLREALAIDPVQLHKGDVAYVLLKTTTGKIRFDPVKDTNGLRRVHILEVDEGMLVDGDLVAEHLAAQRERIAEAKLAREAEERGGVIQYPSDEELLEAHEAGDHADALIEGCVECQREADLDAAEKAEAAPPDEYTDLAGTELAALCRERGLKVGGKGDVLRERLRAFDRDGAPS